MLGLNHIVNRLSNITVQTECAPINLQLNDIIDELTQVCCGLGRIKNERNLVDDQDVDLYINRLLYGDNNG